MKILVICQRYWPEQFQVTDICEGSQAAVTMSLFSVDFQMLDSQIRRVEYPEYQHGNNRHQEHNGIHIVRSFEIGRRTGVLESRKLLLLLEIG